jgi:glutamate synthase domain-containing protein 3
LEYATGTHYSELNKLLKILDKAGAEKIEIDNVYGQRYIGTDLKSDLSIDIFGTPGNDLGVFMNGQKLTVHGNAQDCTGNTMNEGQIVIHGRAGDITGYGMRGGKIFVKDDIGYRSGIHMKEYMGKKPYIVVGGTAQDFLGEYMAGGVLLVLGLTLKTGEKHRAKFVGTGMHGGVIYISGEVTNLGKEVKVTDVNNNDLTMIKSLAKEYCTNFNANIDNVMERKYQKIIPVSHRPYGTVYAY